MKQPGHQLYRLLLVVGISLIMRFLPSRGSVVVTNVTTDQQNETEVLRNDTDCIDFMKCRNTTINADDMTCDYSQGWNIRGSDWGCCGNYDGCCTYASLVCYFHDAICKCCDVGSSFCGPTCKPEVGCSSLLETNDDNKSNSFFNSTSNIEDSETLDSSDKGHLDIAVIENTINNPNGLNETHYIADERILDAAAQMFNLTNENVGETGSGDMEFKVKV